MICGIWAKGLWNYHRLRHLYDSTHHNIPLRLGKTIYWVIKWLNWFEIWQVAWQQCYQAAWEICCFTHWNHLILQYMRIWKSRPFVGKSHEMAWNISKLYKEKIISVMMVEVKGLSICVRVWRNINWSGVRNVYIQYIELWGYTYVSYQ